MKTVSEILEQASEIYIQRNEEYADAYKIHGKIMNELFPDGVQLNTKRDHVNFGILTMMVSKLTRICQNFHSGHEDSLLDLITYSAMLKETYQKDNE